MTPPDLKTYSTSIRFPLELRPRIAAAESRRPTEWIREAVRDALARSEAKPAPWALRRGEGVLADTSALNRGLLCLLAVSAACLGLGWTALGAAWRNSDADLYTFLASAAEWPWLLIALLGARVWFRKRARNPDPFEHFLAVYAAGTAAALGGGAATLAVAGWEFPVLPCPDGPLAAPCAMAVSMTLAAVFAGLTLGVVFPALLPVAAAAISAATLRRRTPSHLRLRTGIAAVAFGWLLAAAGGLVLAHG